jgi:hypothetical protein
MAITARCEISWVTSTSSLLREEQKRQELRLDPKGYDVQAENEGFQGGDCTGPSRCYIVISMICCGEG